MQRKIISNTLHIGTRLDNYEIDKVLGQGGFGIVYKATDLQSRSSVAIKEFFPSTLSIMRTDDQTQITANSEDDFKSFEIGLDKFRQEANALAQFEHPNIVQIIDYIRAYGTEYFVMPYERGMTLADYINNYGGFSNEEIINLLVPILNGLEMMHEHNIFHRDIKPDNIFLREDGMPMLIDFGAARQAIGEKSQDFTQILTHGYAPPEQYETKASNQGAWSDFYALGATFYTVMTGERPPPASDRINALVSTNQDTIIYPRGNYDEILLNSFMKAMNIKKEDRFQNANEWFEFLFSKGNFNINREDGYLRKGTQLELSATSYLEIIKLINSTANENKYRVKYVVDTKDEIGVFSEFYPRTLSSDKNYLLEMVDFYKNYFPSTFDCEYIPQLYYSNDGVIGSYQILNDKFITLDEYMTYEVGLNSLDEEMIVNIALKILEYLKICKGDESFLHLGINLESILMADEKIILASTGWADYCGLIIEKHQQKTSHISQAERDYNYILADGYMDISSDIYALGIVIYRLMVGIDVKLDNYMTRLNSDVDPYVIPNSYSSKLRTVVSRAMALNEKNRISSIEEFIDALTKIT